MRRWIATLVLVFFPVLSVGADTAAVTLDVENMTCTVCPITVRKALERVPGVVSAKVDFVAKTAQVEFDSARATPEALARAVTNAGFPASVRRN